MKRREKWIHRKVKEEPTGEGDDDETADEGADGTGTVEKVTPAGVKQLWGASDGKTFEKKADCVAHQEELDKAASPKTEAELLRERLAKATNPDAEPKRMQPVLEDLDRLSKVVSALSTPFEGGEPKLEKGMYTVNRFSNVSLRHGFTVPFDQVRGTAVKVATRTTHLWQLMSSAPSRHSALRSSAMRPSRFRNCSPAWTMTLWSATTTTTTTPCRPIPRTVLRKDVCSVITDLREPSRETRETLAKAFGFDEGDEPQDEMTPGLKKRFDALEAENTELKKVAGEAVEKVEELAKRVEKVEATPLPRAPKNIAHRPVTAPSSGRLPTPRKRNRRLHDMLKTEGADAVATKLIKLAQSNPQHMSLPGNKEQRGDRGRKPTSPLPGTVRFHQPMHTTESE
jgi:hypothetical protein